MHLTPRELDRLVLFTAAELARRRRSRGLRLNYPEARALIADEIVEGARDGRDVAELMELGAQVLTEDDVLPGVAELVATVQVEAVFDDGQKLVTVHDAIRPALTRAGVSKQVGERDVPGEIRAAEGEIELSAGRRTVTFTVVNEGDRPVQVGSHYHFFETNRALRFPRRAAFGMHLDLPAGTSARFEPGQESTVALVAFGGRAVVHGLNALTNGGTGPDRLPAALDRAHTAGFNDQEEVRGQDEPAGVCPDVWPDDRGPGSAR